MALDRFRGWWILAVTCGIVMLSNGLTLGGITVFDRELLSALGVGRAELKFRDLVQMLTAAAAAPFLGALADRFGVRPLMALGLALLAVGFAAYPWVSSVHQLYAVHVILGLGLSSTGLVLCVSVVARWFETRKGIALGLVLAGGSLGNALLPLLNTMLNQQLGWQRAFLVIAALPLALVPLVIWVVRERPADIGQQPHGTRHLGATARDASSAPVPGHQEGPRFAAAVRTREFACLGVIAFCTFSALVGITTHLFLYLKDRGLADAVAASGLTALFLMGLTGKLLAGVMADRLGLKLTLIGYVVCMMGGVGGMWVADSGTPWLSIGMLGLGWGGLYTLQQLAAAEFFKGPSLGRIVGSLVLIDSTGAALGPWVIGLLYDRTGSYDLSLQLILGLLAVAFLATVLLRSVRLPAVSAATS
jgi:MFS family permease